MEKAKTSGKVETRTIFAGDDTGLLKKIKLTLAVVDEVISAPVKRRFPRKRFQPEGEENLEEKKVEEVIDPENQGVIRKRAEISMKLVSKFGSQEKDNGIDYLSWTLGQLNNDYVSYARPKKGIVEVFDSQTDAVYSLKDYSKILDGIQIKGLLASGQELPKVK